MTDWAYPNAGVRCGGVEQTGRATHVRLVHGSTWEATVTLSGDYDKGGRCFVSRCSPGILERVSREQLIAAAKKIMGVHHGS